MWSRKRSIGRNGDGDGRTHRDENELALGDVHDSLAVVSRAVPILESSTVYPLAAGGRNESVSVLPDPEVEGERGEGPKREERRGHERQVRAKHLPRKNFQGPRRCQIRRKRVSILCGTLRERRS
jgi:hypothetical protein